MPEFDESREVAQQAAFDAVLMHALNVERNTRGMTADMSAIVEESGGDLARELGERLENLAPGELSALSRYQPGQRLDRFSTRVQGVIQLINEWASTLSASILEKWQSDAVEFVEQEIDFNQELFASILADSAPFALSARQVYRRAMEEPVMGRFVESALRDEATATRERVYATIRGGITQGQTNQQVIRSLRGTKTSNYRDGVLNTTRNNLSSIVRTGRTHLSSTTNDDVYEALGVDELVFTATIDGRTSLVCSSTDGSIWKRSDPKLPRPPLHWNCRSVLVPYFGGKISGERPYVKAFKPIRRIRKDDRPEDMVGQVKASTSMSEFLRRPGNAAFAKQYFGETRYRLFKEGKISIKQMIRADGTRYSIAELRARNREAFREVFGDAA